MNKADASLKLSLERLEQAQPGQEEPEKVPVPTPVAVEFLDATNPGLPPARGSLFTPSAEVFEDQGPREETSDLPSPLPPAPLPAPAPTRASKPAPTPSTADPTATPPSLAVPTHLAREEVHHDAQAQREPHISRLQLVAAIALSALAATLFTWFLVNRAPAEEPPPPQVNELAQSIANQMLAAESGELDRREGLIAHDEGRLLEGLEALVQGNETLARQHERSLKRARKIEVSLGGFARRAGELSRTGQSAPLRDSAATLETEARGYLTALGQLIEQLEVEREASLERARNLRDRLDHRPLRGRMVRVIHDPPRAEDAARVVDLLNSLEMDAQLFKAEIADPSLHKGRLFYSNDEEEAAARQIARLVEGIERVEPEKIGVASPYLSLWIVDEPF